MNLSFLLWLPEKSLKMHPGPELDENFYTVSFLKLSSKKVCLL